MNESATPDAVVRFWDEEIGPAGWYSGGAALDATIRERFEPTWQALHAGGLEHWRMCAEGVLAYLLVADQFSRNMFRGSAMAFATDVRALGAAKSAIAQGYDMEIDEPLRQFFYLPLEHSESGSDQARAVRLIAMRMPRTGAETLLHARAHREIIRRFGRFPFRNEALGRRHSPLEQAFLDGGGYGALLRDLRPAA